MTTTTKWATARQVVAIAWRTPRRPPSRRSAWVMTLVWLGALCLPVLSICLNPERGLDLTIWVGWCNWFSIIADGTMLYRSILGLLWAYNIPWEDAE